MAFAKLTVAPEVVTAWNAASAAGAPAVLLLAANAETAAVTLTRVVDVPAPAAAAAAAAAAVAAAHDAALDAVFGVLGVEVGAGERPVLALFTLGGDGGGEHAVVQWTVLTFLPEGRADLKPAVKSAYASARDSVKRALEGGHFTRDYQATETEEVGAAAYRKHADRSDRLAAMSEKEKLQLDVVAASNAARLVVSPTAKAVAVPYTVSPALATALKGATGEGAPASLQLEIAVDGTTLLLVSNGAPTSDDPKAVTAALAEATTRRAVAATPAATGLMSPTKAEPRYFLMRLGAAAAPST